MRENTEEITGLSTPGADQLVCIVTVHLLPKPLTQHTRTKEAPANKSQCSRGGGKAEDWSHGERLSVPSCMSEGPTEDAEMEKL